jgi:hypothetical protein
MRFCLILLLVASCNIMGNGDDSIDENFFYTESSSLYNHLIDFWRLEESSGSMRYSVLGSYNLSQDAAVPSTTGINGNGVTCTPSGLRDSGFSESVVVSDNLNVSFWYQEIIANNSGVIFDAGGALTVRTLNQDAQSDNTDILVDWGGNTVFFEDVIPTSSFNHYSINVYNLGLTMDLYINGSYNSTISNDGTNHTGTLTMIALWSDTTGALMAQGNLDSVGLWRRELTGDEIYYLYSGNNSLDH